MVRGTLPPGPALPVRVYSSGGPDLGRVKTGGQDFRFLVEEVESVQKCRADGAGGMEGDLGRELIDWAEA